jgi:hypothetical protein
MEDSVETYLGSAALFELTFLDSPELRAGGYPERWGMTSLLGVDFGGSIAVVGAIQDDDEFDTKTRFDDIEDTEDDDDFADDEDDEDEEDEDDDFDDDEEDDEDDEDFGEDF